MAIGRETLENVFKVTNPKWRTSITKVEPNQIVTRGYSQEDLIGNISFSEMVYLLLKGEMPTKKESKLLSAVLVSFCDHGVTPPSTQAARLIASAGSPVHACIAGGLLAFGKNHAGAIERSMKALQGAFDSDSPDDIKIIAQNLVNTYLKKGKKIPGFGHRYHKEDPRAKKLIEIARKHSCVGPHTQLAIEIQDILSDLKNVCMNIDGANAGILSDMGFDWRTGTGLFMIGRLPGLISHVYEEKVREPAFRKFFDGDEIYYDGVDERKISYINFEE
ncbi:citryl-CoA lyase [Methanobacterium alcaliphilum]|uniref:citryl-CoA lyase n=1 Tax=Methanobacterium alcaliphilum TaxID=392018 RepID=UPI002009E98E|nr:citryl-CoA lyase [Methanobacterium alcaliphilum]MCK9150989.1 citryl-CoA lyase [Methanobacterium alcaliphilum]